MFRIDTGIFSHRTDHERWARLWAFSRERRPLFIPAGHPNHPGGCRAQGPDLFTNGGAGLGQAVVGALCAGGTAFLSIRFLLKYFETDTLKPFAYYCIGAGAAALLYLAL
ncbi:hypothetical protein NKK52_29515 [Mesorhizobium sp. C277A]